MAYFKRRYFPKRSYGLPFKWIGLVLILLMLLLFVWFWRLFR
jgi:Mg2+ and Co2+ transporter CorA